MEGIRVHDKNENKKTKLQEIKLFGSINRTTGKLD